MVTIISFETFYIILFEAYMYIYYFQMILIVLQCLEK